MLPERYVIQFSQGSSEPYYPDEDEKLGAMLTQPEEAELGGH